MRSLRHHRIAPILLGAITVIGASVGSQTTAAGTTAPPSILICDVRDVHATRAAIWAETTPSETSVQWRIEYATAEAGPWSIAANGTIEVGAQVDGGGAELHKLSPSTHYYVRCVAENSSGQASTITSFSTTAAGPPEVERLRPVNDDFETNIGTVFANYEATIQTNGAETKYNIEFSPNKEKLELEEGTLLASGAVSVAEDFARVEVHIKELEPATGYYIAVRASNDRCEGGINQPCTVANTTFTTRFVHPATVLKETEDISATSLHVTGSVYPGTHETKWYFEIAPSEDSTEWKRIAGAEGSIAQAEADETLHKVSGDIVGLTPLTVYYIRLNAENAIGGATTDVGSPLEMQKVETGGAPRAETFAVHAVHEGALRLLAAVRPDGYDTHYRFQYVAKNEACGWSCASESQPIDAGAGSLHRERRYPEAEPIEFEPQIVGGDLPSLEPGTTYRFRVSAYNEMGETLGAERTVAVPAVSDASANICPNSELRSGLSAHLADCRAYEQVTPVDKEGAMEMFAYSTNVNEGTLIGEDGNHFAFVAKFTHWRTGNSPYFFSRESAGWNMTAGAPPAEAGINRYQPEVFSSDLTEFGFESLWATSGDASSPEREFRVGTPGGPYTTYARVPSKQASGGGWVASSQDFKHLFLQVEDHAICGHSTGTFVGADLYEYADGACRQVNVKTDGTKIGSCGAHIAHGWAEKGTRHSVSADGSRVFFEAAPTTNCSEQTMHLYVRIDHSETLDLGPYRFAAADGDGTVAMLEKRNSELRETFIENVDSGQTKTIWSGKDEIEAVATEDFSAVYFFSGDQLTSEAPRGGGLYRYDIPTGAMRFVVQAKLRLVSEPSPDGRYYYFGATEVGGLPAGGVDASGKHVVQLFRYDSVEDAIACISCASSFDPEPRLNVDNENGAAGLNRATAYGMPKQTYESADGNYAFFATPAALLPQDQNGEVPPEPQNCNQGTCPEHAGGSPSTDVYEWRRDGLDGCKNLQGCLSLITPGTDGFLVALLGTDGTGHDVFFTTNDQLLPQDGDSAGDVYDARVDGGFREAASPPPCEGDACFSPPAAPIDSTPASLAFVGPGNAKTHVALRRKKPKHRKHRHRVHKRRGRRHR